MQLIVKGTFVAGHYRLVDDVRPLDRFTISHVGKDSKVFASADTLGTKEPVPMNGFRAWRTQENNVTNRAVDIDVQGTAEITLQWESQP